MTENKSAEQASDQTQPRIRAKLVNDTVDYLHNDLADAALYFRHRVVQLAPGDDLQRLFPELIAAVTMIAFALEGYSNFLVERLIPSLDDRSTVVQKIKAVRKATGIAVNWNKRPYSTIIQLVDLRNRLAHPKTYRAEPREWEAVGTDSEFWAILHAYAPEYEKLLTPEFVVEAYDDVDAIWRQLRRAAHIPETETVSRGVKGFELLGPAHP